MTNLSMMDMQRAAKEAKRLDVWKNRFNKTAPWIYLLAFFVIVWAVQQSRPIV